MCYSITCVMTDNYKVLFAYAEESGLGCTAVWIIIILATVIHHNVLLRITSNREIGGCTFINKHTMSSLLLFFLYYILDVTYFCRL